MSIATILIILLIIFLLGGFSTYGGRLSNTGYGLGTPGIGIVGLVLLVVVILLITGNIH